MMQFFMRSRPSLERVSVQYIILIYKMKFLLCEASGRRPEPPVCTPDVPDFFPGMVPYKFRDFLSTPGRLSYFPVGLRTPAKLVMH